MTAATVDRPSDVGTSAWWFLDALVVQHRTAPQMTGVVLEMTLPVGHAPASHVHETLDDTWYVLDGRMAARCGDDEYVVEAGDWVSMPRGIPHAFRVVGDTPARILAVHDNSTFRDFVSALGIPTDDRVLPVTPSFPPLERLAQVAQAHALVPVGPPMSEAEAQEIVAGVLGQLSPT